MSFIFIPGILFWSSFLNIFLLRIFRYFFSSQVLTPPKSVPLPQQEQRSGKLICIRLLGLVMLEGQRLGRNVISLWRFSLNMAISPLLVKNPQMTRKENSIDRTYMLYTLYTHIYIYIECSLNIYIHKTMNKHYY